MDTTSAASTTVALKNFGSPTGKLYTAVASAYKGGQIAITINRSVERRPAFYTVNLAPRAGTGSWEMRDGVSGTIENLEQRKREDGVVVITGMWAENGLLYEMETVLSAEVSSVVP